MKGRDDAHWILTINAGSSSLKFAAFSQPDFSKRQLSGKFESTIKNPGGTDQETPLTLPNHAACLPALLAILKESGVAIAAIAHRVVHGGPNYCEPRVIDAAVITKLKRISQFAPEHLPVEIELIEKFSEQYSHVAQVACFDTAFHQTILPEARMLPIPRKYYEKGIRRYGFHGLSYGYLMQELDRVAGTAAAQGRVILAHLGNGASMAAVRECRSIDTTMAFTPAAGLVMSSRSGDLDPGVATYLMRAEGMAADQFHRMVNEESGMLGISQISPDVRELLKREQTDPRAAEALQIFSYHARKWIGALAAALGGLDTLVFSGGIGENGAETRARICEGFQFLGIQLDDSRNQAHGSIISKDGSRATVRVIRTDEEAFMARLVDRLLFQS